MLLRGARVELMEFGEQLRLILLRNADPGIDDLDAEGVRIFRAASNEDLSALVAELDGVRRPDSTT